MLCLTRNTVALVSQSPITKSERGLQPTPLWPQTFELIRFFFPVYLRFYLFIHERQREREAETQAEREASLPQGARCRTLSWILGSGTEPKADAQPLSHPGVLCLPNLKSTSKEALSGLSHVYHAGVFNTASPSQGSIFGAASGGKKGKQSPHYKNMEVGEESWGQAHGHIGSCRFVIKFPQHMLQVSKYSYF